MKEEKAFLILENDLCKIIDDVEFFLQFVVLLYKLDGDKINLKCDTIDEIIYYRIKRKLGYPILEYVDARQMLQSYEKTILNKINNIKNNSQFSSLENGLIVVLSELQVELKKNNINGMGKMTGIKVDLTIQGIGEEYTNISKLLKYLEEIVGYFGYIDKLELLSKKEIQDYQNHIDSFQFLNKELTTKIQKKIRV